MSLIRFSIFAIFLVGLAACSSSQKKEEEKIQGRFTEASMPSVAEVIYFNGDIITMEKDNPTVQAVAVARGRIMAMGHTQQMQPYRGPVTKMVDLKGKTMVPGFVDGHSHIGSYVGIWGTPDLSPPPVGDVRNVNDIVKKVQAYIQDAKIPEGQVAFAVGYDDSMLQERRHPTAKDLDRISTTRPIFILHASGHLAVGNTAMLKLAGFKKGSKAPEGGRILFDKTTGLPTGVVEEQAVFNFFAKIPPGTMEDNLTKLDFVQNYYASQGITTAQEGQTLPGTMALLREAAKQNRLKMDVVAYPKWTNFNDVMNGSRKLDVNYFPPGYENNPQLWSYHSQKEVFNSPVIEGQARQNVGIYDRRLKVGGIKITQDGSPQGKTAYLSKPYLRVPAGEKADYRGFPILTQDQLDQWLDAAYRSDVQVFVHCNGDAAADMMIEAVRKAQEKYGQKDLRPVMIHAQTVREDQLDKMKQLGITPSFFSAHTYFWGDWHVSETLGLERASKISPMASALRREMTIANHSDAPVIPPNPMRLMDSAVNRTTRTGKILGPGERISAFESLKALTLGGAYLYFEEEVKGSIRPGKMADFAILSANPLKVNPTTIKDIFVLETIKEGQTIFAKVDSMQVVPRLGIEEREELQYQRTPRDP
ncbi:amidohydrolase [Bdellovibrio bacteriovorus]|uniref:amidohydrolase n=1 Tax=Bdellovibrio bacteriovorus TaxID=959 RepID=UPI0035A6E93E